MKKITLLLLFFFTTSFLFAQDTLLWKGRAKGDTNILWKGKKRFHSAICEVQITDSSLQIIPIEKFLDQMPTAIQNEIKFQVNRTKFGRFVFFFKKMILIIY